MAQQIKKKFLAPEVLEYFDDQIDLVESSLAQEVVDRIAGDSDTLQGAKDYTDLKISEIPEVDLSNYYTKLEVDTKDSALDSRLDVLEAFGYEQILHVSKNGSDSNTGKQHSPFLTITAAQNAITDASPTKRYAIKVAPGNYSEAIALKANVFIVGEGQKESVRITGSVTMGASFTGGGSIDNRSGFGNLTLLSAANFDWNSVQSAAGKLYFSEVVFGSTVNMYGYSNAIAQAQFNACVIFGALTISGINVGVFTNNVCYGNINLNQHPNGGMATILVATGGYCQGTITQTAAVNDFNRRSASFFRHFNCEQLVLNGPSVYADVDLVSQGKQLPTISNGANLIALNPTINHDLTTQMIVPKSTNSHNMGDWGKQWTWNFGYVHASTGTDLFLISYPSSFAPDSSGKSIGIYTDGAGLQENVNGGEIEIATAETSGTGIRGKITLNGREIDVTSKQIKNLADGTLATDAVNKGQLDSAIAAIPPTDLSGYYTKTEVDSIESGLQDQIDTEKGRLDAILLAADADKDSFKEVVDLINSIDTENDSAFAGYVLSNDERVTNVEARVSDLEAKHPVDLASDVTGILPIANGGTGASYIGPMEMLFGSPDGQSIDRSEFFTYDASIGLFLNVGGQMQTRSLEQGANDPSSIVINDKVEVVVNDVDGPAYTRMRKDYIEAKKVLSDKEFSASMGFDGTDSWLGVSETQNEGNNISMIKLFPHKAQLFTVDISLGNGPQAILPVEQYDLTTKKYVDDTVAASATHFAKGSVVVGAELAFIDLDREYSTILSMSVGRLAVHEGEDYTLSVVGGVTRVTWIGSLVNPGGAEKIETGDKIFWSGAY